MAGPRSAPVAGSPACSARSAALRTPLVELYTSEGCNSCPPADRWLSATFPPDADAPPAIALAFHVDYWDRLGWKDRFAAPEWGARQYAAMRANRSRFVYTPQVLLDGRDLPDWRSGAARVAPGGASSRAPGADIALEARPQPHSIAVTAAARVAAPADRRRAVLAVALVDSGLFTDVKAGENSGVRLRHDHVVRSLAAIAVDADGEARGEVALPVPAEAGSATTIVAFVQDAATGAVLQTLALPLARCAASR